MYIYIYKLKKEKIRPGGYKTQNSEKKKDNKRQEFTNSI